MICNALISDSGIGGWQRSWQLFFCLRAGSSLRYFAHVVSPFSALKRLAKCGSPQRGWSLGISPGMGRRRIHVGDMTRIPIAIGAGV